MSLKMRRNTCFYAIGTTMAELLAAAVWQLFETHPFSPFAIVEGIGTVGLAFLNLGLIIFIYQGGFFDSIVYSFRRFSRSVRQRRLGENEAEAPMAEYKTRHGERWPLTGPLIGVSLLFFISSLIFACFL